MRWASKHDANHPEITACLKKLGWQVVSLSRVGGGVPDLLIGRRGVMYLVEIKNPDGGVLSKGQKEWADWWTGPPPFVVKSVEDVLAIPELT